MASTMPAITPMTARRLRTVKIAHTLIWAFFAGCTLAIPAAAWTRRFDVAFPLIGFVTIEVLILLANAWRCPLTGIAARYTDDRRANFDIYLPAWIARYNKEIFGPVFVVGVLLTAAAWFGWLG